jgi:hypothetical protein
MIHTLHPTQQKIWNDLLEIQKELPHGWVARYDSEHEKVFYYNFISNQKTYQIPLYARDEFGLPLSRPPAVRKMDPVWPSEDDPPFTENDPKAGEWKGAEYMTNIAKNESMSPQQAEWARRKQDNEEKRDKQGEDLQRRLDALGGGTKKRRRRRRRRTLKKF